MEIMLKNKCCLYVIISIRFFSITICNLLIEFPSYLAQSVTICKFSKIIQGLPVIYVPCVTSWYLEDISTEISTVAAAHNKSYLNLDSLNIVISNPLVSIESICSTLCCVPLLLQLTCCRGFTDL